MRSQRARFVAFRWTGSPSRPRDTRLDMVRAAARTAGVIARAYESLGTSDVSYGSGRLSGLASSQDGVPTAGYRDEPRMAAARRLSRRCRALGWRRLGVLTSTALEVVP